MGLFMSTNKKVSIKNIAANNYVQIDSPTTLSFYIKERVQSTLISSVAYSVNKVSGRSSEVLSAWVDLDLTNIEDDIYNFDYTVTGVTPDDSIVFNFKVIDTDGVEYFLSINDISIIL